MISFKRALLSVLFIIICLRLSLVFKIIEVNSSIENNWINIFYYFSFIAFPLGILILLKGNFNEVKKLVVNEKKDEIVQIFFFSFAGYFFFLTFYNMTFYVLKISMNIPIEFTQMKYTFSFLFSSIFLFPIFEELFFRRLLAHHFFERYGFKKAVFYSAFLFTIAHNLNNGGLLDLFLFGSIFAFIYLKTRNVYLVVVLHMLNNIFYFLLSGTITPVIMLFEDYKHLKYFWFFYGLGFLTLGWVIYYSFRYINRYHAKYHSK